MVIVFLRWTVTPGGSSHLADFLAWVQGQGAVGANLSDYMPSRIETAERMLEVAGVGPDQVFLDIGSGDGRLVVLAARAGAEAIGIDRQELLVERARDNAAMAGVADRARFVHADALDVPSIVERADVVAVFLTIAGLSVVGPYLAEVLRPGAIVVWNTFAVPGWRPESVTMVEGRPALGPDAGVPLPGAGGLRRRRGGLRVAAQGRALVVVESPAKCRTIQKYLEPSYVVQGMARYGPRSVTRSPHSSRIRAPARRFPMICRGDSAPARAGSGAGPRHEVGAVRDRVEEPDALPGHERPVAFGEQAKSTGWSASSAVRQAMP